MIICAGSAPRAIPGMDVDGVKVITSDQSTNSDAEKLPERVAVIGGGVIGAEFASVFTDLGVSTTLLEALPNPILPLGPDRDVANILARSLTRRGLTVHGEARVGTLEHTGSGVVVPFETPEGLGQDRGRPGARVDRAPPGHRGHRRGGGGRPARPTAGSSTSTPPRC